MRILFLVLVLISLTAFDIPDEIPYPPKDPQCVDDWTFLPTFYKEECVYCNKTVPYGDYYLFACRIERNGGQTIKFESICTYTSSVTRLTLTFLPIVSRR